MQSYFVLMHYEAGWKVSEFKYNGVNSPFKEALDYRRAAILRGHMPENVVMAHGMNMYDGMEEHTK